MDGLVLSEKLMLVEDIWDSIAISNVDVSVPQWQKKELDKRYQSYKESTQTLQNGIRCIKHCVKSINEAMKLCYSEKAKEDVEFAFVCYERQKRGLDFEFLDCIENFVRSVIDNPEIYKFAYSHFRRCIVRRFPFFIPLKIPK